MAKASTSRTPPANSPQSTRLVKTTRSRVLAEIEALRKNLSTLEQLLESELSSNYNVPGFREPNDDPWFEALRGFPPMSFCDYEMISMRNGSMVFDGPLSYRAVALKDPFLAMVIKRGHLHNDVECSRTTKRRKLSNAKYDSESGPSPSLQQSADSISRITYELPKNKPTDDYQVSDKVKERLQPNLEQINKNDGNQDKKEKDKPLSMKHILNETEGNEFIDSAMREKAGAQRNESPPTGDIELWTNIKTILDNLQTLRSSNLKYELSQSVIPVQEHLFGYSPACYKNPEHEILVRVQALLPPEKAIWLQLDNYFKSPIYGLYPVLSEKWFRESLQAIIGPNKNRESVPIVSVSEKLDFAHLGVLMCILSLSHMTLVESTSQNLTNEEKYLLSHSISGECMDVAELCMDLFKVLQKPLLPVFYCGLLIRIFRRFARDEGDSIEAADTSSFTGLIVEVAYGLGLNTDLERSSQFAEHEVYLHQWRKNWYLVFLLAMDEALTAGNCLSIDDKSYATKLPSVSVDDKGNFPSFVTNPSLEVASINCIRSNYELALVHHKALKLVTNKSDLISCGEIHKMLHELEGATAAACGPSLATILAKPADNLESAVVKLGAFRGFIRSKAFILLLTTALFIHVDKMEVKESDINQSKISISYMKKLVSMYVDLEPLLVLLFFGYDKTSDNVHRIFGRASEVIVMQACVEFLAKFVPVLYLLISRCLHLKFTFMNKQHDEEIQESSEETEILSSLEAVVSKGMDKLSHINAIISKLSRFNFQVWKLSKSSLSMYNLLKDQSANLQEHYRESASRQDDIDDQETRKQDADDSFANLANYLPKSNTFEKASSNDWQEIHTLLCYTNYNIFAPYIEEQNLKLARDFRVQAELLGSEKDGTRMEEANLANAEFVAKTTQDEMLAGAVQQSERETSNSPTEHSRRSRKLTAMGWLEEDRMSNFEDIDQLWNESMLRTDIRSMKDKANLVHGKTEGSTTSGQSEYKAGLSSNESSESSPSREGSSQHMSPEELLKSQILQQDHIIKQLQQLTTAQLNKLNA